MTRTKNLVIFFIFSFLFILAGTLTNAQLIKYVSYFPIPYGYHSKINVKTLALLGTKSGGEIVIGSGANAGGGLSVTKTFTVNDLSVKSSTDSGGTPDLYIGTASGSTYDGYLNSVGDIGVVDLATTLTDVSAQGIATVRSIYWDGKGGLGKNSSAVADWPATCNLAWVNLKIKGSDSYRTYLTCASATIQEPETPTTTIVYQPYSKQLAVARYCEAGHRAYFINWGSQYSYDTMDERKFSYYKYADSITVVSNSKYDTNCYCAAGVLGSGGMQELKSTDTSSPWAGAAVGFKIAGHLKEHDYTFNNVYNLGDCPSNLSEQQICDKYCTGSSCNYSCIKSRNVTEDCGTALDTYECFCPKYGSCCGLCEDGTGQPSCGSCNSGESCCTLSPCGRTVSCMGGSSGACGEFTYHRAYEPTIGTATVLACRAIEQAVRGQI